nr:hypothetical protein CFP56_06112 [Quercus suber]
MLSLTTTTFCSCSRLLVSPNSWPQSRSLPSVVFVTDSRRRRKRRKTVQAHTQLVSLSFVVAKESCGGGFLGFQRPPGFVRRCVKWDSEEGNLALEGNQPIYLKLLYCATAALAVNCASRQGASKAGELCFKSVNT